MNDNIYTDSEADELFGAIYSGDVTIYNLPEPLYNRTAERLTKALKKGYNGTKLAFEFGKPDPELLEELRQSLYFFSAAKTATQIDDITSLLIDGEKVRSLSEFKKVALQRFTTYNVSYLESEYITTTTSASSAANFKFTQDNKGLFPRLKSIAILDEFTADVCRRMDGVIARVDDPIWNHNLAPRHFRCRCMEERLDKYDDDLSTSPAKVKEIMEANDKEMDDRFKFNPAKEKIIFSKKHPYYEIGKRYPELATNNFNLPINEK